MFDTIDWINKHVNMTKQRSEGRGVMSHNFAFHEPRNKPLRSCSGGLFTSIKFPWGEITNFQRDHYVVKSARAHSLPRVYKFNNTYRPKKTECNVSKRQWQLCFNLSLLKWTQQAERSKMETLWVKRRTREFFSQHDSREEKMVDHGVTKKACLPHPHH